MTGDDVRVPTSHGAVFDGLNEADETAVQLASVLPPSPTPAGLGPAGWLRWGWRVLTSMRTALVLLFLLAVAAVPGSVLPQRGADPAAVNRWIADHPGLGRWFDRVGLFDVFGSAWFSAIYLLLFISLIGCVIPRIGRQWRAVRAPIPAPPRQLSRLPGSRLVPHSPEIWPRAEALLRSHRWRVRRDPNGQWLAAEQGRSRETGNLLFHLSLLAVLIAVALGGLFGWKGTVIVREGTGFADVLPQFDTFRGGRLTDESALPAFSFTLRDFDATFQRSGSQRGAPASFAADLDYQSRPGAPTQARRVEVNHPLVLDGAKIFLLGHGYAPHLRVRDAAGQVVFDDTVVFLPQDGNFTSSGVLKLPDASKPLFLSALFLPTAALDASGPHSTFPAPDNPMLFASAFTGPSEGQPANVYQLDTAQLTQLGLRTMSVGQTWTLPKGAGEVTFVGFDRWASFSIAHDPGKGAALLGAVAGLSGLVLSLFVRRRRLWIGPANPPVSVENQVPIGDGVASLAESSAGSLVVAGVDRSGRDSGSVSGEVAWLAAALVAGGTGSEGEEAR